MAISPLCSPYEGDGSRVPRMAALLEPSYNTSMRVATGRVVSGRVVVEGAPLPEGTLVTVLSPGESELFELDACATDALLASIAEAEAGDLVDGEQFLRELWDRR
jgi:hypothetical protein